MKKVFRASIALVIISLWGGCVTTGGFSYKGKVAPGGWLRNIKVPARVGTVEFSRSLQVYFPKGYKRGQALRTLIILHGYNGSMRDWEKNTVIEKFADQYRIALVSPAMGKSLYASQYFPETKTKWSPLPGGPYMTEELIPFIRKTFNLATDRARTGIMGLSTGGRGALLTAARMPEHFAAAAGLSGDYDPLSMTRNRLLRNAYGKHKNFKTRWQDNDNLMRMAIKLKGVAIFLSHGAKDYIVPREQSMLLAMRLRQLDKKEGGYKVTYNEVSHGLHDWRYWRRVLPEMMKFFDEKLAK